MLTKDDFIAALQATIANYPTLATLYQVQDPRLLQGMEAQAAMLALLSAQIETALAEPFEKVRDATVLADAALKGIMNKSTPTRVSLSVVNANATVFTINAGTLLSDANGNPYAVDTPVTIAANGTGTCTALQQSQRRLSHTVSGSCPFYQINIPDATDGTTLAGIAIANAVGVSFTFSDKFTNIGVGDLVFHVEVDEYQRTFVRFGWGGVVGYQPTEGEVLTLTLTDSFGSVQPATGSPFAFQYLYTPTYANVSLTLAAILTAGQDPLDIGTLRDLCRYPSVYDSSAVYLGEFDLVIRKNFPSLAFLSVWNEAVEESARGASVDNINVLFVACMSTSGTELSLTQTSTPVAPTVILLANQTGMQQAITATVAAADDSYKVRFYTPVISEIVMTVAATVPSSYDETAVQAQITALILANYGVYTDAAKHGALNPTYQGAYALLYANIAALQNSASDVVVTISQPPSPSRPELWRYVGTDSLTVTVTLASVVTAAWGV